MLSISFPSLALASPFAHCSHVTSRDPSKWRACTQANTRSATLLFIQCIAQSANLCNQLALTTRGCTQKPTSLIL